MILTDEKIITKEIEEDGVRWLVLYKELRRTRVNDEISIKQYIFKNLKKDLQKFRIPDLILQQTGDAIFADLDNVGYLRYEKNIEEDLDEDYGTERRY